jgi:hypothetical protein
MESADAIAWEAFMEDDDRLPKVPEISPLPCSFHLSHTHLRFRRSLWWTGERYLPWLAARELRLTVQEENTTQIDADMYITRLKIGNMLREDSYDRETKEFAGDIAETRNISVQNAYHVVLKYPENQKRVIIDDYSAPTVSEL